MSSSFYSPSIFLVLIAPVPFEVLLKLFAAGDYI